jgi:hypothetical protein
VHSRNDLYTFVPNVLYNNILQTSTRTFKKKKTFAVGVQRLVYIYIYYYFLRGEVDIITTSSGKGRFGCFTLVTIKNRGYLGLARGALENGSTEDTAPHYKKNIFSFSFLVKFA